jgi:hypothetical protein
VQAVRGVNQSVFRFPSAEAAAAAELLPHPHRNRRHCPKRRAERAPGRPEPPAPVQAQVLRRQAPQRERARQPSPLTPPQEPAQQWQSQALRLRRVPPQLPVQQQRSGSRSDSRRGIHRFRGRHSDGRHSDGRHSGGSSGGSGRGDGGRRIGIGIEIVVIGQCRRRH